MNMNEKNLLTFFPQQKKKEFVQQTPNKFFSNKKQSNHCFFYLKTYAFFPKKNETTATKITAPKIEGTIAMPAALGPQSPKIA